MRIRHVYYHTGGGPRREDKTEYFPVPPHPRDEWATHLILKASELVMGADNPLSGDCIGYNMYWSLEGTEIRIDEVLKKSQGYTPFHTYTLMENDR